MTEKINQSDKNIFEEAGCVLISPKDIVQRSSGQIIDPDTFNWRTGIATKDGLYDPRIFGLSKYFFHHCDKVRGFCRRLKDTVCPYCNESITKVDKKIILRFGHIVLSSPVYNYKYLEIIANLLDMDLEIIRAVIYDGAYIITKVDVEKKKIAEEKIILDFEKKIKNNINSGSKKELKQTYKQALLEISLLHEKQVFNYREYFYILKKYENIFLADTGVKPIEELLKGINLREEIKILEELNNLGNASSIEKNEKRIKIMKDFLNFEINPSWIIINYLPVLSPAFRPFISTDKTWTASDLTQIYQRIINCNNRLKKLIDSNFPFNMIIGEKIRLQELVDRLYKHEYFVNSLNETFIEIKELIYKFIADSVFDKNLIKEKIKASFDSEQKLIKAITGEDISEEDVPDFTKEYIDSRLEYGVFLKKYLNAFGKLKEEMNEKAEWMSKYGGNPSFIKDLEAITDNQAECLSHIGTHELYLDNLKSITDKQMEYLACFNGEVLSLNSIQWITDNQARSLSSFKGEALTLNSVKSLTDNQSKLLSDFGRQVEFNCFRLELGGVLSITDKQAEWLSKFSGERLLIGTESISNEQLIWLMKFSGKTLYLTGLSSLTNIQIEILSNFQGEFISLRNVKSITDEQSKLLLKNKIKCLLDRNGLVLHYIAKYLN